MTFVVSLYCVIILVLYNMSIEWVPVKPQRSLMKQRNNDKSITMLQDMKFVDIDAVNDEVLWN